MQTKHHKMTVSIFEEIVSVGYENRHIKVKQFSIAQRESEESLDTDYKEALHFKFDCHVKKD